MPTTVALPPTPMPNDLPSIASLTVTPPRPVAQSSPVTLPATQTSTVSLTSNTSPRTSVLEVGTVPTLKYNQGVRFQAMTFHPNVGKNVSLDPSATVAARLDEEFAQGYVFSHHNITPGERIVIQVLGNEDSYIGSFFILF